MVRPPHLSGASSRYAASHATKTAGDKSHFYFINSSSFSYWTAELEDPEIDQLIVGCADEITMATHTAELAWIGRLSSLIRITSR